uniref:Ig-like domain-containing protein n=1 Tax=Gongylonema pulchrum TaxID=637853 RepID=A0A183EM71_9BILA
LQRYIIYYTKNPEDPLADWDKTSVDGDQLEVSIPADEDTPYNVRIQAATRDGAGIISEAYDVTTGKKPIPLTVKLDVSYPEVREGDRETIVEPLRTIPIPLTVKLDVSYPEVREGDRETIVEPLRTIRFKCVARGRPVPQISYTWLPFNETESGQAEQCACLSSRSGWCGMTKNGQYKGL